MQFLCIANFFLDGSVSLPLAASDMRVLMQIARRSATLVVIGLFLSGGYEPFKYWRVPGVR